MTNAKYEYERLTGKRAIARRMTEEALRFALADCLDCVARGLNVERYTDEAEAYRSELGVRLVYGKYKGRAR